jgi:hypothetical protein
VSKGKQANNRLTAGFVIVIALLVLCFLFLNQIGVPKEEGVSGRPAAIQQNSQRECDQSLAEVALLDRVQRQLTPIAQLGRSTTWKLAGPCGWEVDGIAGWRDPYTQEPTM